MISTLSGIVREIEQDALVVETHGVGFTVFVPTSVRDSVHVGESIYLYTQLIVRQDAMLLVGFDSKELRHFFNLFIGVNGVGMRLALAILSTLSPDVIRRAVFHEQAEVFGRVPGVGKKTAQKIVLALQDKIGAEAGAERVSGISEVDMDVLSALTSLGYSVVEAQAAIQSIPRDTADDLETRLRIALKYFNLP